MGTETVPSGPKEDGDDRAPRNDCGDGGMKDLHKVAFNAAGALKGVLCGT
jgi:hypothetical protein